MMIPTNKTNYQVDPKQIEDLAYSLYKMDWKTKHGITLDDEKAMARSYYRYLSKKPEAEESFEEFIDMVGYPGGNMYDSKEVFLETEMNSFEYLQYLLPAEVLDAVKSFRDLEEPVIDEDWELK